MEPRLPVPGDAIAGKFAVTRVLGRGRTGHVVEARHLRLDRTVAIKLLLPEHAARPEVVARFEREASAVVQLRSDHVTKVFDVDVDPRTRLPFVVMERLAGRDLASELAARGGARLAVPEAVDWILEACAGLHDAGALGIVHRDVRPANLFLVDAPTDAPRSLKVMDVGVANVIGREERDPVVALAEILARALSARRASPRMLDALSRALADDPEKRPSDVVELAKLLAPFGTGRVPPMETRDVTSRRPQPVLAPLPPSEEPTVIDPALSAKPPGLSAKPPRPRARAAIGLVVATSLLAVVAGLAWSRESRPRHDSVRSSAGIQP